VRFSGAARPRVTIHGGDIKIEGAAAHLRGHVFNYLPGQHRRQAECPSVARGARLCDSTASSRRGRIIATGNTLVIGGALERPSLESNRDQGLTRKSDEDCKNRCAIGLSAGKTFTASTLRVSDAYPYTGPARPLLPKGRRDRPASASAIRRDDRLRMSMTWPTTGARQPHIGWNAPQSAISTSSATRLQGQ